MQLCLAQPSLGTSNFSRQPARAFSLHHVQLCQCMAQRGASNTASHNRALRKTLQRRSLCTRSSQQALTTSTSTSTTSSLPRTLLAIFLFSFLFIIFVNNIFLNNSFWKQEVDKNNELSKTAWAQELDKHLANKTFQEEQLQQQLPENIQEKKYKKEKLELQEQNLELSGRSALQPSSSENNNSDSNKALATQLWQNELGMNLADPAAWNIQLYKRNSDNITLELAENPA